MLTYAPGKTVTSNTRTVTIVQAPVTEAVIHYDGDATLWGLHLFGDGLAPGEAHAAWETPTPFEGSDAYGPLHTIQIADDTKKVGFIVHRLPPGDPNTKDPAGSPDRFFIPLATPEIWLKSGETTIYTARRPTPPARCRRPDERATRAAAQAAARRSRIRTASMRFSRTDSTRIE